MQLLRTCRNDQDITGPSRVVHPMQAQRGQLRLDPVPVVAAQMIVESYLIRAESRRRQPDAIVASRCSPLEPERHANQCQRARSDFRGRGNG